MSSTEIAGLILAAAAAGAVNAVAGGGTLLTFPTLLFFRTPAVVANATSTLALVLGTSGSLYGYRGHLHAVKPWLWRFVPVSILGGLIGAALLTRTEERVFSRLVPFLILFATILFLLQGMFRRFINLNATNTAPLSPQNTKHKTRNTEHEARSTNLESRIARPLSSPTTAAILFQFLVAIYGGYFGAGIGILMLASLGFIGFHDIHEMNTLKTILGSLINLVAAIWFIFAGLVDWPKAAIMTIGAMFGYYLGAHFSQRIPQQRVRQIITAIGFIISTLTFYEQFVK